MTNCYDQGQLRAYLDGELPPLERAALGAHLAGCAACQGQLAHQRGLAARVSSLLAVPPTAPEPRAALARLRAASNPTARKVPASQGFHIQRSKFMPSNS